MAIITYQPTNCEIDQIIATGKAKHNAYAFLYDAAATILRKGHIGYAFDDWHCLSQTDPGFPLGQVYRLTDGACNCPSYTKAQFHIANRVYCKHAVAYYALLKILEAQFNQRWIGNTLDPQAIQRYRDQPNTWLLQHYATPSFLTWNGVNGHFVCFATPVPNGVAHKRYAPANPLQFAHFSNWLATTADHACPVGNLPTRSN